MELLTPDQIQKLRDYLASNGVSYESLQTEMLDHLCCDIELYVSEGMTFEEALEKVKLEVPKIHLKKIQTETMESINSTNKPMNVLTGFSFFCLLLATLFKTLHLPGAATLLMVSFGGFALMLLTGFFTNPLIKQKNRGRVILFALVTSILTYMGSLLFQAFHLSGTGVLRITSVVSSMIILSGYAIYGYQNPIKVSQHMIIKYFEKQSFRVEKTLIVLLMLGVLFKFWQNDFTTTIFFMMQFGFGAIFYFVRCWPYFETH